MLKLPLKCAVVSLYSVVKQRLKRYTSKVCNSLIQFLVTTLLSIEDRAFLVEYAFREGNRYTDLVQEQFAEKFPETPVAHRNAVYRDRPRTLNDLKTAITAYMRNISQADLQKVFVNRMKRVQACIDACSHHFKHLS
jgi:Na+/phosphate symporter